MSGKPLTISKWGQGEPSGEHDAPFMSKAFSNGERGVFSNVNRTRWGNLTAYICEISKGNFFFNIIFSKLKGIINASA